MSWVYLQYGVQVITRQLTPGNSFDSVLVSIIVALLMFGVSYAITALSRTPYFHRHIRRFFADYGMPISLVAASAMAYWGRFNETDPLTLPVGRAFHAAGGRDWLVKFWELDGKWVGIACPFGIILWILFFFDHNVSVSHFSINVMRVENNGLLQSLMAQGSEFPLKKPPGFHYDFFLLGVTTFIAGLLGLPAPNGLIPQAPIHTSSLVVMGRSSKEAKDDAEDPQTKSQSDPRSRTQTHTRSSVRNDDNDLTAGSIFHDQSPPTDPTSRHRHEVPVAVIEQRVSNLAQGSLCLVLLTGPFLHVLNLIPRGVLAGLFWYMGADALRCNGITQKILYLLQDKALTSRREPLHRVRKSRILLFVGVQLVGFAATFAITQTIGKLLLFRLFGLFC